MAEFLSIKGAIERVTCYDHAVDLLLRYLDNKGLRYGHMDIVIGNETFLTLVPNDRTGYELDN